MEKLTPPNGVTAPNYSTFEVANNGNSRTLTGSENSALAHNIIVVGEIHDGDNISKDNENK